MILHNKFIGQIKLLFSILLDFLHKYKLCNQVVRVKKQSWLNILQRELRILIFGDLSSIENNRIAPEGILGICINTNNIILIHLIRGINLEIIVKSFKVIDFPNFNVNFQDLEQNAQIQQHIMEYINTYHLHNINAAYVLSEKQYIISLVELTEESNASKDKAILWGVKDYLNYPIEDAVLDSFEIPIKRTEDQVKLIYAVAIKSKLSIDLVQFFQDCGIFIKYIDLNELCIRNILGLDPELKDQGMVVIKIFDNYSNILLVHNNAIFLSRVTKLNLRQLHDFDPNNDNMPEKLTILEGFLLELQRSMSYGNNVFQGLNFNTIKLLNVHGNLLKVIAWLQQKLNLPVMEFDLTKFVKFEQEIPSDLYGDWVLAVGAGLRIFSSKEQINAATN